MANEHLNIKNIPAIIWGDTSSKVYLYIHGQGGYKEVYTVKEDIKKKQKHLRLLQIVMDGKY